MPRLLIANVNNENMLADRSIVTYEFACATSNTAKKHAWFAEPGDIVVLPEPLSEEMASYASEIKGFSMGDDVAFISPRQSSSEIELLCFESLHDHAFIAQLEALMGERRDWTLMPYYFDRSVASLGRILGIAVRPAAEAFRLNGGHELLNDKKAFRSLAAGRGVPLSEGETCSSLSQLRWALDWLLDETGAVIVKHNKRANASGNIIISRTTNVDGQGASEVLTIDRNWTQERIIETVWKRLGRGPDCHLVVEAYHPVRAICYAEFEIREDCRGPIFLNWGEQRMEPVFTGFDIPGTMPPYQAARFICGATDLARLAQDVGFLGLIDVDGIITDSGEVIFNEVNGRFAGCSHVHYLAELLMGPGYGDRMTLLTRNKIAAPLFGDVVALLKSESLAFSGETEEGIVITGEDTARTGNLGYMAISESRARAMELEARFTDLMALASHQIGMATGSLGAVPLRH